MHETKSCESGERFGRLGLSSVVSSFDKAQRSLSSRGFVCSSLHAVIFLQAIVSSSSNLLEPSKNASWRDLPQQEQRRSAEQLVHAVEESAELLASRVTEVTPPKVNIEVNISESLRIIAR